MRRAGIGLGLALAVLVAAFVVVAKSSTHPDVAAPPSPSPTPSTVDLGHGIGSAHVLTLETAPRAISAGQAIHAVYRTTSSQQRSWLRRANTVDRALYERGSGPYWLIAWHTCIRQNLGSGGGIYSPAILTPPPGKCFPTTLVAFVDAAGAHAGRTLGVGETSQKTRRSRLQVQTKQ